MNRLNLLLRKIDLFGRPLNFEFKESQKYHTLAGNIITVLLIIICCVFGFLIGHEIYERKTPSIIVSEEIVPISRFTFKDFPIIMYFAYLDGSPIVNSQLAFNLNIDILTIDENFMADYKVINGWLKECTIDSFDPKYESLIAKVLNDNNNAGAEKQEMLCPDVNLFVQNGYITNNSTLVNFRIATCDKNERECHPDQDLISKEFYFVLRVFDAFVDPKNYTYPIVYNPTTYTQQISSFLNKRNYFSIEKRKLITHKGCCLKILLMKSI